MQACARRIETLLPGERYEEAAVHRDRVAAFVRAAARLQRLTGLTVLPQVVAGVPRVDRGWDVGVVRWGRLAASIARAGGHTAGTVSGCRGGLGRDGAGRVRPHARGQRRGK